MRTNIYIITLLILSVLVGCTDELNKKVKFDMSVISEGATRDGDTLIVTKSTPVIFNFSGNPDFISFYSGETGHAYKNRNRTLLSKDEITSELRFSSYAQYGTIIGVFSVYLSTSFGELSFNKKEDSIKIKNHDWIDISDMCNLPTTSSTNLNDAIIPLEDYLGEKLTIAFLYKPFNDGKNKPTWEIQNIKVVNTSKSDGSVSELPASSMGLTPFDMYEEGAKAYQPGTVAGTWNLSNISANPPRVRMQSSGPETINEDWLITNPFSINATVPDTGVGIKTITDRLNDYTYQYDKTGTYVVTFVARNSNVESESEIVREVVIKVVD